MFNMSNLHYMLETLTATVSLPHLTVKSKIRENTELSFSKLRFICQNWKDPSDRLQCQNSPRLYFIYNETPTVKTCAEKSEIT